MPVVAYAQLDVLGHIAGRKADAAVAAGGDERAVVTDAIDGPRRSVADHLAAVGAQPTVIVPRGDLVADEASSTCDPGVSAVRVDLAGVDANELGSFVEHGDGLVRRCHRRRLSPAAGGATTCGSHCVPSAWTGRHGGAPCES